MINLKRFVFTLLLILFITQSAFSQDSQIAIDCSSFLFNSFIEIEYSYYFSPFFSLRFNLGYSILTSNLFLFEIGIIKFAKEYSGFFCGIDFGIIKWTEKSIEFGGYLFNLFLGYRIKITSFFIDPAITIGMLSQPLCIDNDLKEGALLGFMLEFGYLF